MVVMSNGTSGNRSPGSTLPSGSSVSTCIAPESRHGRAAPAERPTELPPERPGARPCRPTAGAVPPRGGGGGHRARGRDDRRAGLGELAVVGELRVALAHGGPRRGRLVPVRGGPRPRRQRPADGGLLLRRGHGDQAGAR